jgi:hypothetical protein
MTIIIKTEISPYRHKENKLSSCHRCLIISKNDLPMGVQMDINMARLVEKSIDI